MNIYEEYRALRLLTVHPLQVIAVEKSEAEAALAEALPALEEARLALDDLDRNDVTEIR